MQIQTRQKKGGEKGRSGKFLLHYEDGEDVLSQSIAGKKAGQKNAWIPSSPHSPG
jgi:hypothetical protein